MTISAHEIRQLPDVALPPGYDLRGLQRGDEQGVIDVLTAVEFGDWDHKRLADYLAPPERQDGTRVIMYGSDIVAVTFATRRTLKPRVGSIDFVTCHPLHQGKGLGRAICTAVLRYLLDQGVEWAVLSTDDWRLPAINLYLSIGFRPENVRHDMPSRWESIRQKLGLLTSLRLEVHRNIYETLRSVQ